MVRVHVGDLLTTTYYACPGWQPLKRVTSRYTGVGVGCNWMPEWLRFVDQGKCGGSFVGSIWSHGQALPKPHGSWPGCPTNMCHNSRLICNTGPRAPCLSLRPSGCPCQDSSSFSRSMFGRLLGKGSAMALCTTLTAASAITMAPQIGEEL